MVFTLQTWLNRICYGRSISFLDGKDLTQHSHSFYRVWGCTAFRCCGRCFGTRWLTWTDVFSHTFTDFVFFLLTLFDSCTYVEFDCIHFHVQGLWVMVTQSTIDLFCWLMSNSLKDVECLSSFLPKYFVIWFAVFGHLVNFQQKSPHFLRNLKLWLSLLFVGFCWGFDLFLCLCWLSSHFSVFCVSSQVDLHSRNYVLSIAEYHLRSIREGNLDHFSVKANHSKSDRPMLFLFSTFCFSRANVGDNYPWRNTKCAFLLGFQTTNVSILIVMICSDFWSDDASLKLWVYVLPPDGSIFPAWALCGNSCVIRFSRETSSCVLLINSAFHEQTWKILSDFLPKVFLPGIEWTCGCGCNSLTNSTFVNCDVHFLPCCRLVNCL